MQSDFIDSNFEEPGDEETAESLSVISLDKSQYMWLRFTAMTRLTRLGGAEALQSLLYVAQDTNERNFVRTEAIWSLGWLGDKRAAKPLIKILENKEEASDVRSAAVLGLGNLVGGITRHREKRHIAPLIRALEDPHPIVRREAAEAFYALVASYHATHASGSEPNSRELTYFGGVVAVEALERAVKDNDSSVRAWAAIVLGKVGSYKTAYKPLVTLLEDEHEDSDIRCAVVNSLIDLHDRRAIKCFISVLQNIKTKARVRRACTEALSYFGGKQTVRTLIALLEDGDQRIRVTAVESLGWTGGGICHKWTVSALVPLLMSDNEILFSKALEALERIADERTVPELLRIKKSAAENSLLQTAIAIAIDHVKTKQGRPEASEVSIAKSSLDLGAILIDVLVDIDEDWATRLEVVDHLEKFVVQQAVEPLLHIVHDKSEDLFIRVRAINALRAFAEVDVLSLVVAIAKDTDEDESMRHEVIRFLADLDYAAVILLYVEALRNNMDFISRMAKVALDISVKPEVLTHLITLLQDSSAPVEARSTSAFLLAEAGGSRAIKPLVAALAWADAVIRSSVAMALEEIGGTRVIKPLLGMLDDQDSSVRSTAVYALGRLQSPSIEGALFRSLDDSSLEVRMAAMRSLVHRSDLSVVPFLLKALTDSAAAMRSEAALALGEMGCEAAVEPLILRLQDSEAEVRVSSCRALGKLSNPIAVEPLSRRLRDTEVQVRRWAAVSLGKLGDRRAVAPLIDTLGDADSSMRSCAASALGSIGSLEALPALMKMQREDEGETVARGKLADLAAKVISQIENNSS